MIHKTREQNAHLSRNIKAQKRYWFLMRLYWLSFDGSAFYIDEQRLKRFLALVSHYESTPTDPDIHFKPVYRCFRYPISVFFVDKTIYLKINQLDLFGYEKKVIFVPTKSSSNYEPFYRSQKPY